MNSGTVLIAALVIVAAVGLVSWVGLAMARVEEELDSFIGIEGLHFEL